MKKLLVFLFVLGNIPVFIAQDNQQKNVARIITKNLGVIDNHAFVLTEHLNEAFRHLSVDADEKKYVYDRVISIAEYNESGFVKNVQLSDLPGFPKGQEVFDAVMVKNNFYILCGTKSNGSFTGEIIGYDAKLDQQIGAKYPIKFNELKNKYHMRLYAQGKDLLVLNSIYFHKNKPGKLQTALVRLDDEEILENSIDLNPKQLMNLNDWYFDSKDNLKLIYSTERPEYDINPEDKDFKNISTVFIEMNNNSSTVKEYDYTSNTAFVPTNFRFVPVDNDRLLITAIAIPKSGIEAGYFISESQSSDPLSFDASKVVIPTNYKELKFWSNLEEPKLNKGKCPVTYRKQYLDRAFVQGNHLVFMENSYSYTGDEGLVHEGNFSVAAFNISDFTPVSFFRSEYRDCPIQGYCLNSSIVCAGFENTLKCYYLTIKHEEVFGVTKKEFGAIQEQNRLIECTLDLTTGQAAQRYIPTTKGLPYMDLGPAFFIDTIFNYIVYSRGMDYHNLPKLLVEQVK